MIYHLFMTLLAQLLSPLQMFLKLLFKWMLRNLPAWDKVSFGVLQSCAEALTEPLFHLFFHSLRYVTLSTSWKVHNVVPVPKAGDPHSVRNHRPISLLSNTSKVLEWLIYNKIIPDQSTSVLFHQKLFHITVNAYFPGPNY